jgi:hypothetical protein
MTERKSLHRYSLDHSLDGTLIPTPKPAELKRGPGELTREDHLAALRLYRSYREWWTENRELIEALGISDEVHTFSDEVIWPLCGDDWTIG